MNSCNAGVVTGRNPAGKKERGKMTNELTPIDGFDADAHDPTASPIRGTGLRFKDGDYFAFSESVDVQGKSYVVLDRLQGWQKLEAGCPPEYLMRRPGELRPPRPHVDEADWPLNFNGQPEHPWKLTHYLHLLDAESGEFSTFWTNTTGGNLAVGQLSDQVNFMRQVRPNAIAVIALESREMPTKYGGTKPRPHFQILGWRERTGLAGPEQKEPLKLAAETPATKLEQAAAVTEKPAARAPDKPADTSTKATKSAKTTKRGVTRFDSPAFTPMETPSTAEVLDDEIPL
jgi:hypothetical protein